MAKPPRSRRPMSERRARSDAEFARLYKQHLPRNHPYGILPTWVPYWIASRFARWMDRHGRTPER